MSHFCSLKKEDKHFFLMKIKKILQDPKYEDKTLSKNDYNVKDYKEAVLYLSSKDVRAMANINNYADNKYHYFPHKNPARKGFLKDHMIVNKLEKYKCIEYSILGGGAGVGTYEITYLTYIGRLIISTFSKHIEKYGEWEIIDKNILERCPSLEVGVPYVKI